MPESGHQPPLIEYKNVTIRRGEFTALDSLNMSIGIGEHVAEPSLRQLRHAGRRLREAQRAIFIGYSLPSDDVEVIYSVDGEATVILAPERVTAVLEGEVRLGLDAADEARILGIARKAAERDVAVAVGQRWPLGATTVSASVAIAAAAARPRYHRLLLRSEPVL